MGEIELRMLSRFGQLSILMLLKNNEWNIPKNGLSIVDASTSARIKKAILLIHIW